jgi:tetratricopeptide (TPR) repeat protein
VRHFDEAILQYLAANKLAPNNPAFLEGLGLAYSEQGQRDLAIDAFKKATAADPQSASRYHYQLGRAYLLANRFGEAVNLLLLARRASPLSVEVLIDLSTSYLGEGKQTQAEETLTQAFNLDPYHPAIERFRVNRANTTPAKQVR